jgi:PKD domain/Secretion system C-terminal sorting domain
MRPLLRACFLLAACALATSTAVAQTAPANDQCQTATLVTSGAMVTGTLAGAADDIPGVIGCQTSAGTVYPDVWYAFVATAPTVNYSIVDILPTVTDTISAYLFSGSCGNQLTMQASSCGIGTATGVGNGLIIGNTYYLAATASTGRDFRLTIDLVTPVVFPAQDCDNAVILNQLDSVQQGGLNMGAGAYTNEVAPTNSCWGSGGERQPKWYRFTAGSTGTLEFNINPTDPNTDYDWAVWDITANPQTCTADPNHVLGNAIACNWSGARGATGLSSCPSLEPGYQAGDQFDNTTTGMTGANAPVLIEAGHVYALLVDNFSTNSTGYTLLFGGACAPSPTGPRSAVIGMSATFTANTRPGMTVEFVPNVTVSNTVAVGYHWSFGDGATSTLRTPSHTYSTAGTYYTTLEVTDLLGTRATYARTTTASITGIADEVARATRLSLSPNPAQQQVRLTLAEPVSAKATAQLYNSLGRLVRTVAMPTGATSADLDLNGLRAGVYSVRVGGEVRRLVISE